MVVKPNAASKDAPDYLMVSGITDDKVRLLVRGLYVKSDRSNAGKPVYKRQVTSGQKGQKEVLIYFWDDQDGPDFCGWWFALEVGGDETIAYNPNKKSSVPPLGGWKVPYDGKVDNAFRVAKTDPPKEEPKKVAQIPAKRKDPPSIEPTSKARKTEEKEPIKEPVKEVIIKAAPPPVDNTKVTKLLGGYGHGDDSDSSEEVAPPPKKEAEVPILGLADVLKSKGIEIQKQKEEKPTKTEKDKADLDTLKYNGIWKKKGSTIIVAEIKDGCLTWAPKYREDGPVPRRPPVPLTYLGGMVVMHFKEQMITGRMTEDGLKWSDGDTWIPGPSPDLFTLEEAAIRQAIEDGLIQVEDSDDDADDEEEQARKEEEAQAVARWNRIQAEQAERERQRDEALRRAKREKLERDLKLYSGNFGPQTKVAEKVVHQATKEGITVEDEAIDLEEDEDAKDPRFKDLAQLQAVEELLRRALKEKTEKLGEFHPTTLETLANLCAVLNAMDKEEEATKITAREITGFEDVEVEDSELEEELEEVGEAEEIKFDSGERHLLASTLWKEDDYDKGGHTMVWGSLYDKESGKWGYACCEQYERFATCTKAETNDEQFVGDFVDFDAPLSAEQATVTVWKSK